MCSTHREPAVGPVCLPPRSDRDWVGGGGAQQACHNSTSGGNIAFERYRERETAFRIFIFINIMLINPNLNAEVHNYRFTMLCVTWDGDNIKTKVKRPQIKVEQENTSYLQLEINEILMTETYKKWLTIMCCYNVDHTKLFLLVF